MKKYYEDREYLNKVYDILENDEKNIEDEIDLKIKTKKLYTRMKDILKGREQTIIELRFGLRR